MYMMIICKVNDDLKDVTQNIDQYNDHLPLVDDLDLYKLIYQYQKVFCDFLPKSLFPEREVKLAIKRGNAKPVNINVYPLSKTYMDEQVKQVTELLNKRLIQHLSYPQRFPVLFVKKPIGWRMCIDY